MMARLARLDDAAYLKRRRAERAGKAQTVTGLVHPSTLGATLMHEHLLIDASHLELVPVDPEAARRCRCIREATRTPRSRSSRSWRRPAPISVARSSATSQRLDWLDWLIGEGHGGQLVVSHDNDNKIFQARHGGPGYAHILTNIVRGFVEESIRAMLVDTPRRVLAFA